MNVDQRTRMLQTDAFVSIQCSKLWMRPGLCPEQSWGS